MHDKRMAWRTITLQEFTRKVSGTPQDGPSPGGAAADLGITRQAVHNAIARGSLDAYRILRDGQLMAIIVSADSMARYRQNQRQRA